MFLRSRLAFALVVIASALPSFAQFSPELPVSTAAPGRAVNAQLTPQIASDGTNAFAVWTDVRSGIAAIYGVLIGADAHRLTNDFEIIPGSYFATVVWTGRQYLVVGSTNSGVAVRRVGADGTLIDAQPRIVLGSNGSFVSRIAAATNGGVVIVGAGNVLMTLDLEGNALRSATLREGAEITSITSNGGSFLLITIEQIGGQRSIVATTVGADGVPEGSSTIAWGTQITALTGIAWNGREYLVTWADGILYGVRLTSDRSAPAAISQIVPSAFAVPGGPFYPAALATADGGFAVAYVDGAPGSNVQAVKLGRIASNGTILGTPQVLSTPGVNVGALAIAPVQGHAIVVNQGGADYDVYAMSVDPATAQTLSAPVPLAISASLQTSPRVVRCGASYFAMWQETTADGVSLRIGATDAAGVNLSGRGVVVDPRSANGYSIGCDGPNVIAVWSVGSIFAQRFTQSLVPVDADPVRLSGPGPGYPTSNNLGYLPSIASSPTGETLITWSEPAFEGISGEIYGQLLHAADVTITPSRFAISANGLNNYNAQPVWGGREFLVAWTTGLPDSGLILSPPLPPMLDFRVRRVSINGSPLGSETTIVPRTTGRKSASVASNGYGYVLAWTEIESYTRPVSFVMTRALDANGAPIGDSSSSGTVIAETSRNNTPFVASRDANEYAVVWADDAGVHARGVGRDARPSSNIASFAASRVVLSDVAGGVRPLIAYSRPVEGAEFGGVSRAILRFLDALPRPRTRAAAAR